VILNPDTIDRDLALRADVCVIGSGAGGSVAAYELAQAGRRVVVIEEGGYRTSRDFTQREEEMYPRLYHDAGARAATDSTVLISQGCTVGGSTVTSFCVCARPARAVLDQWERSLGIPGVGATAMAPQYQRVEAALSVREVAPAEVNRNNQIVQLGAERLGLHAVRVAHNRIDCLGCGYCALGCAYDRKTDALATHLRWASQRGALIVPDCRVEAITTDGSRATGVSGTFLRGGSAGRKLTLHAPVVVLAAGAIGSPRLWLGSRLPNPHRQVGRHLHLHPQVLVAGVFVEKVEGWRGIPQSVVVDEFFARNGANGGGFLLAPLFAHPMALAALLPGFGAEHRDLLEHYARLSVCAVMLHDRSGGSVEIDPNGRAVVNYHLNDEDREAVSEGMRRLADIYLAAGAQRVVLPFTELASVAQRGDYRPIDERPLRPNDPMVLSFHPQGSLRMGLDRKRSVVNAFGEAHEVPGLFVADASVFPTAIGVPPQLSVMAFAGRTARYIAANGTRYFPAT
jgi:choline dehydrogenase-like flavoprotein